jgi:hypothetical protein
MDTKKEKEKSSKEIELHPQNLLTTLNSIVNTIGRVHMDKH